MGVEQADPELPGNSGKGVEQGGKPRSPRRVDRLPRPGFFLPEIHPVVGGVLANEVDLFHAGGDEPLDLLHHRLNRAAPVTPSHPRNDAEGTGVIAPLGDLYIGRMGGRETHPRRIIIRDVSGAAGDLDERFLTGIIEQAVKKSSRPLDLVETHEGINLWKLDGEIGCIPLRKTPPDDEFLSGFGTVKAATMCFEDRPDALLLGRIDESAGIDQDHVCFVGLRG